VGVAITQPDRLTNQIERFTMTPSFDYSDDKTLSTRAMSDEDQEREAYLNEVSQQSTQFGCQSWQYEATYDFNDE